ncbi:hypothetical protein [Flavobacterium sp. 3HN19-14]|uniref:hypothetical protein n=1 Tax=Flavobacterium sp. 3HN19-14 TaxID=3448133 RepID=UPI003EE2E35B
MPATSKTVRRQHQPMKNIIILLAFHFSIICFGQTNKLPVPSKSFLEQIHIKDNADLIYLSKYLGKKSEKTLERFDESKQVCSAEYKFGTGIILTQNFCSESGNNVKIVFPFYPKSEIVKYVEWLFKTNENDWNNDKTRYQPKEDGNPGCYLQIKTFKEKTVLEYYCGC